MKKEKKENQKQVKVKNKIDKQRVFSKAMALILLVAMVLASCSTCIYFIVESIK